jgi:membrane fusion protein, heavy metal efflux system
MNRYLPFLIVTSALAIACGGSTPSPGEKSADRSAEAKAPKDQVVLTAEEQATGKIETQPAELTEAPAVLHVTGRIARADDRTWRVGVRTEGLVRTVPVNLGDAVRKDQVLARYHADEVREERAKYRTAQSELQRLEAAAALAQRNADRAKSLFDLKAASALQVDQAQQDLVAAQAAVKNARVEVERTTDVLEDDLRVPVEATAGDEEADLVPIFAPASGFVLEKNVTPGRTIAPGQDAFVIGDLSQVWMLASVHQESLGQLRVGQPASVTLAGLGDERFTGAITNLGQELDPTLRVMQVRIRLNNPGQRLRPEMLANAEIPIGQATPTLTVSSDTVQQINGQDVVFVRASPDRFVVRPVHVGSTTDGRTTIVEGLKSGELVVVRGSFVLKSHLLKASMEAE